MKKWLLAGCIVLLLFLAAIYIFIPSTLNVSAILLLKCNVNGADRFLRDSSQLVKWLPDEKAEGIRDEVTGRFLRMVEITIREGNVTIPGRLSVFPKVAIDSSILQWETSLHCGLNPFKRIAQYQDAGRLKANMEVVLSRLGALLEKEENVYGIIVRESPTTDSLLVLTDKLCKEYPSTDDIYKLVEALDKFVRGQGGHQTGCPMVNVTKQIDGDFQVKVALPTDKQLAPSATIYCRHLVNGKYLEADVRGGEGRIKAAMSQMSNYIGDYNRTVMAIPFQSLVTDRSREPDTTKWLTKLYYPIF